MLRQDSSATASKKRATLAALMMSAALAGCGGGGDWQESGPLSPLPPPPPPPPPVQQAVQPGNVRVHYLRADATYTGWGVYSWNGPITPSSGWPDAGKNRFTLTDMWGAYVDVPVQLSAGTMDFLINDTAGAKAPDNCDLHYTLPNNIATQGREVWVKADTCTLYDAVPPAAATMRVHYHRADNTYTGWGVYSWNGPATPSSGWPDAGKFRFDKQDPWGWYVDVPVNVAAGTFDFLINDTAGNKSPDNCDMHTTLSAGIATAGQEVWVDSATCAALDAKP